MRLTPPSTRRLGPLAAGPRYFDWPRTVRTGHDAVATTREATLPSTARATPVRPWVPSTRISARRPRAARTICSATGAPSTRRLETRIPARLATAVSRCKWRCAAAPLVDSLEQMITPESLGVAAELDEPLAGRLDLYCDEMASDRPDWRAPWRWP